MAHTRKTLLLDSNWDICLNENGGIAVSIGPYSTAQNVANECRLFTRDACFAQERGIPYFAITLGQSPAYSVLNARLRKAALLVDDVQEVTSIDLETFDTETRKVTGDIKFISKEGENGAIEF